MRAKDDIIEDIERTQDAIKELEENENEDDFEDMLNDEYPEFVFGSLTYGAGTVLKAVDEIAFNCALNDYNDSRITDLENELEDLEQELKDLEEENEEVTK